MENLFFAYLRIYPGKKDIIMDAISKGIADADRLQLTGKDRIDKVNSHILVALD